MKALLLSFSHHSLFFLRIPPVYFLSRSLPKFASAGVAVATLGGSCAANADGDAGANAEADFPLPAEAAALF